MTAKTVLVCLAIALTSWIQSTPDFSGTWKLNIDETEFVGGAKPSPARFSAVRTVEQKPKELRLKIERTANGQKSGFDFVTIPIGRGEHVSDEAGIITAEWKGDTLHFNYLYNPGTARQSERTEDWTLSLDGKKLIDREWFKGADGQERRSTVVFDKQP